MKLHGFIAQVGLLAFGVALGASILGPRTEAQTSTYSADPVLAELLKLGPKLADISERVQFIESRLDGIEATSFGIGLAVDACTERTCVGPYMNDRISEIADAVGAGLVFDNANDRLDRIEFTLGQLCRKTRAAC